VKAIYKRELNAYFTGMTGYLFIAFLLVVVGIYVMMLNFAQNYASFEYVISNISFVFMIITPILTMRAFAEERAQKTDQLLYSLPLSITEVVLGKYFAMLTVFLIPTFIMSFYPFILSFYGTVSIKSAFAAILGFFFMGASLLALGMFMSSLTENQIVSAVLCFGVVLGSYVLTMAASSLSGSSLASFRAFTVMIVLIGLVIWFLTKSFIVAGAFIAVLEIPLVVVYYTNMILLAGAFQKFISNISIFSRMSNFTGGMLDISALVFYTSVACLFVFFTVQSLEKRRWS